MKKRKTLKATESNLLKFLRQVDRCVIPIYQRTYSWEIQNCQQLWEDILRAGRDESIVDYFIGSIVYIEKGLSQVTNQEPPLVIDGQQRLTSVSLIIEALASQVGHDEPVDGFSAKKLRNYYLRNAEEDGERSYKLHLTQTDKKTLWAIVDQECLPDEYSVRIKENFEYYEAQVKALGDDLTPLCKGLAKLTVVDIALDRTQDNPQLIFESMNSTGLELSQSDLVRNFILLGLDPDHQSRLYNNHWRPMEIAFGQKAYVEQFDMFLRYYLTVKYHELPREGDVYKKFKAYASRNDVAIAGTDALVADLHKFSNYYCAIALKREKNPALADAFADLLELRANVTYPLLLELYDDYSTRGLLTANELEQAVRLVESYVFRRAVCGVPTNSMNNTFASFGRALREDSYLKSISETFLGKSPSRDMSGNRRFPNNSEFRSEIVKRNLYDFNRRSYWLRRLENHGRKERIRVDDYTVEHIMPQNENLSEEWREELGEGWQRIHETWLHTLGNLTLTGYNSEYSDRPFTEKRDMKGGFKESPLRVNKMLRTWNQPWDENAIRCRADQLARKAIDVWSTPSLSI